MGRIRLMVVLATLLAQMVSAAGSPSTEKAPHLKPGHLVIEDVTLIDVERGVYRSTFRQGKQTMAAGTEEFLIMCDAAGTHVQAITTPIGGWSKPTLVETHANPAGCVIASKYAEPVRDGLRATYTLQGDTWTASAVKADKEPEPQAMKVPERVMFSAPTNSSLARSMNALNLQPGEALEVNSMGFGFPDWRLAAEPISALCKPDEPVAIAAIQHAAGVYLATAKGRMGQVKQKIWLSERGLPLKVTIAMAFGTVTTELQP